MLSAVIVEPVEYSRSASTFMAYPGLLIRKYPPAEISPLIDATRLDAVPEETFLLSR